MSIGAQTILFVVVLFVGMLLATEIGRRVGAARLARDLERARAGNGAVEGAVFALLGLVIAFTFSGAASRFDIRRNLIVEEANGIGTAWLRLDLLPAADQPEIRNLFRQYLDSRLTTYQQLPDVEAAKGELARSLELQNQIWIRCVAGCQGPEGQRAAMLLLPALNQMFDIVTTRTVALKAHPPAIIFLMLGFLALAGALFAGFGMAGARSRSWVHILGFSLIMAVCVYVILDLEFPRIGLIRVDAFDEVLIQVRESIK